MAPKRHAAGSPSPAKAARRARDELAAGIESVVATLGAEALMPPSVPAQVLGMLAAGAPHALAPAVEERHPLQAAVVEHIRSVFSEAAMGLDARLAEAQAAADGKGREVEAGVARAEAVAAEILASEAAIAAQRTTIAEAEARLKAAEQERAAAEAGRKAGAKERADSARQRDEVKAVQGGLEALVGGVASAKEAEKACGKLMRDMALLDAEPSLLASAPAVLLKAAEQRQGFDAVVIGSLRAHLAERLAASEAALAASAAAGEALEAATAAVAAAAEERRRERDGHVEALGRLRAELAEQGRRQSGAAAEVDALRAAHAEKVGAVADVQEELQFLKESRDTLDALAARSSAPPAEKDAEGTCFDGRRRPVKTTMASPSTRAHVC